MVAFGVTPAAVACRYCARPISALSGQTIELFDMFLGDLNGATSMPRWRSAPHRPVTSADFPASELVPVSRIPVIGMPFVMANVSGPAC